ncbi:MAG: hypothetical protein K9N47_28280 [Prosthecobacter sp.]|uniref:hypothetical protein n=1 Tax=Prosthecobacter sp. TaxID=1965333 RepID=UPI0026217A67|nr:hypothetical protein [Prosthecobacter sp.]MCF7790050.1 hypothetical protein [Prosthecobacter sp.]
MKQLIRVVTGLLILSVISFIALFGYVFFFIDSTEELKRHTFLGELLLRSEAIRMFPAELIAGEKHYFYAPGEPTGKSENIMLIRVPQYDPAMAQKCEKWLLQNGFITTRINTAHTLVAMKASDGREARIEVAGNDITISVQQ